MRAIFIFLITGIILAQVSASNPSRFILSNTTNIVLDESTTFQLDGLYTKQDISGACPCYRKDDGTVIYVAGNGKLQIGQGNCVKMTRCCFELSDNLVGDCASIFSDFAAAKTQPNLTIEFPSTPIINPDPIVQDYTSYYMLLGLLLIGTIAVLAAFKFTPKLST